MRPLCTLLLLLAGCAGSGCSDTAESEPDATATLAPLGGSGVQGTVEITKVSETEVRIDAEISGLTQGKHGMHIHEWGDCSAADGMSAGGHFNPAMVDHGAPGTTTHHPGDFGNVEADASGRASFSLTIDPAPFTLGSGANDALGRAIIVHADPDDYGQPTGNAGGRVACGVINNAAGTAQPKLNPSPAGT